MDSRLYVDIRKGIEQKRDRLYHWLETTPGEKQECQLCAVDDSGVKEHLHVIDTSLEKIEAGTLGVCQVCHDPVDTELLMMDYTASVCLGHYTEQELRQLESELELSQVVQRALLPQQVPSIPGMDIAAFSRPAQIVSGDYFDFLHFQDGAHGFVMADVSGHGMSAGMLMTSLQTAFHTLIPETNSPVDVLQRINRLYVHNVNFSTFVTVFFGRLDLAARTLTYASAGHNPALVHRRDSKEAVWLQPTGPAIGLTEHFAVRPATIQLADEDILLLYTDGVTEAFNAKMEQFGTERLLDVVRQNEARYADGLLKSVRQALNDFTNGQPLVDDVTLVVCKVK
ncbi:MAG: PP2C family protein-serine/threonine phosphatase [Chloroflexota bacterium]